MIFKFQRMPGKFVPIVNFNKNFQDEHIMHLNYELAIQKDHTWSTLFEKVGKLAEIVNAVDYSISQTTLDQVIIIKTNLEVQKSIFECISAKHFWIEFF